jgi:CRP-like cAMP-binding protein
MKKLTAVKTNKALSMVELAEKYAFTEINVKTKTTLLKEGEKARNIYFVKQGCLRLWMNHNGKEITNQFFLEGSLVASLESMMNNQPSDFNLEAIEKSTLYVLDKKKFEVLRQANPEFKDWFNNHILERFIYYSRHLLSFLKDKPEVRYAKLIQSKPEIIQRVPQHYIASYLGITAVSLSRIRNKLSREKQVNIN